MAPTVPIQPAQMQDNHVSSSSAEADAGAQQGRPEDSPQVQQSNDIINLEKEKTPMCLVNELARFNKVIPFPKVTCLPVGQALGWYFSMNHNMVQGKIPENAMSGIRYDFSTYYSPNLILSMNGKAITISNVDYLSQRFSNFPD